MRFARADHEVVGGVLLQDLPDSFHILGRITPVAARFEIAQIERVFAAGQNSGDTACNLSRHESFTTTRALMIEQDAV